MGGSGRLELGEQVLYLLNVLADSDALLHQLSYMEQMRNSGSSFTISYVFPHGICFGGFLFIQD